MLKVDYDVNTRTDKYSVLIDRSIEGAFDALVYYMRGRKVLVLTDKGASDAALSDIVKLLSGANAEFFVHTLEGGESVKSFDALQSIISELIEHSFTRNDLIINLGGGVVGDLGGFAASVYMRGIDHINIPTTLLSMIDSAMGGKTGIDHCGIKNIVGAFHQPRLVLCAVNYLNSLPEREMLSGFGEALKYYCISASPVILSCLLQRSVTPELIEECCIIKRDHVEADVLDGGKRRILNLGHTYGHAFEAASGFSLTHGEAVALGLIAELRLGERLGITEIGTADAALNIVSKLGLTSDCSPYAKSAEEYLKHDKKNASGSIEFAFIRRFGEPFLKRVPIDAAADLLHSLK